MALHDQQAAPVIYPPPVTAYPPSPVHQPPAQKVGYTQGPYIAPPPPIGYPTEDVAGNQQYNPVETRIKGDGFWKGCFAALCCCCMLDVCCC